MMTGLARPANSLYGATRPNFTRALDGPTLIRELGVEVNRYIALQSSHTLCNDCSSLQRSSQLNFPALVRGAWRDRYVIYIHIYISLLLLCIWSISIR